MIEQLIRPDLKPAVERPRDEDLTEHHRFLHGQAFRQAGRDGSGVGAAGAVRIDIGNAFRAEFVGVAVKKSEDIDRAIGFQVDRL